MLARYRPCISYDSRTEERIFWYIYGRISERKFRYVYIDHFWYAGSRPQAGVNLHFEGVFGMFSVSDFYYCFSSVFVALLSDQIEANMYQNSHCASSLLVGLLPIFRPENQ
jgi:hypothetical protein